MRVELVHDSGSRKNVMRMRAVLTEASAKAGINTGRSTRLQFGHESGSGSKPAEIPDCLRRNRHHDAHDGVLIPGELSSGFTIAEWKSHLMVIKRTEGGNPSDYTRTTAETWRCVYNLHTMD